MKIFLDFHFSIAMTKCALEMTFYLHVFKKRFICLNLKLASIAKVLNMNFNISFVSK